MSRAILVALLSHWARQRLQLATLLAGLALATGLWTGVQAINAEARASYAEAAGRVGVGVATYLERPGGEVALTTYVALRRAGWLVAPELEGRITLQGRDLPLTGVDLLSLPLGTDAASGGAPPPEPGTIFAAPRTARELGGDRPVVIVDTLPEGALWADISLAAELLGKPDSLTRLRLLPGQPMKRPPLAEIAPDLVQRDVGAGGGGQDIARLTDSFHLNLTAFGLLSFAVGLFIVHGAIGLAFEQRRPVMRTLRAMGVSTRALSLALVGELLVLAFVAGSLGVMLGYCVA
ncbi:MAG TPA: ABC transporter permease, partial [Aliiroseovarius sp.]|nr:ABC transporter permease [Aliiroseovarius sp.]